jgi:hypothetical protein
VIVTLGGAPIYIEKISNIKKHQELLEPFIQDDSFWRTADEWKSKTTTTHQHPRNHELPWNSIIPEVNNHFEEFIQIFQPNLNGIEIETHPWLNRYETGDWQEQHNHFAPEIFFSMSYIIRSNGEENFVFCDQEYTWYSHFYAKNIFNKWPARQYIPEQPDGTLMIFPSTLDHFVMPNKSKNYRISASANFVIKKR